MLCMYTGREQANADNVAVWDRLYRHLAFLASRGAVSLDELAEVFAPLLISYKSRSFDQVSDHAVLR